nr:uncharacterized protein LOC104119877 isoform X1 [Nicotiana tomentosiformis]
MENVIGSLLSGFGAILGKLFGHPFDFLAGKSCSLVCGPTWDFFCYIENFCISHLLKLAMVSILFYFVLLFLYLLYKLGICGCICHLLCRSTWACFSTCFSVLDCCCTFFCFKLQHFLIKPRHKRPRRRHQRDIEGVYISSTFSEEEQGQGSLYHRASRKIEGRRSVRDQRKEHFRRSLRPKNNKMHRRRRR